MDETELTEDKVHDRLDGGERDAGWDADDEYEWPGDGARVRPR